jgi:subtilase family serine protease
MLTILSPFNPYEFQYSAIGDCTVTFGGTSAAAPMVAGVVALILSSTDRRLGWRDIQHILVRSASIVSPTDPDWTINGGGLYHSHRYDGPYCHNLYNCAKSIYSL